MNKHNLQLIVLFLCISLFAGGCATTTKPPVISADKEMFLKDACEQNGVYWQWDQVSQVATLGYKGIKAEVLVGSDVVLVDKERVTLSAPVRMVRSAVVVPLDFRSKVIMRLTRKAKSLKGYGIAEIREIIIDAGHGGKDPGAIGRYGQQEKTVVLDISKRLKRILQERGFKVRMTRERDEFISLQKRTEIASRSNADLFVSVHANASTIRSVYGLEVYTSKYLGFSDRNEAQRRNNQRLMFRRLSITKNDPNVDNIVSDLLYTRKQARAEELAEKLAKKTSKFIRTKNRGEKKSRFYVLRNTLIPAILVEVGFLTNPKEAKLFQSSTYRQKVARGLAESITDYANGR